MDEDLLMENTFKTERTSLSTTTITAAIHPVIFLLRENICTNALEEKARKSTDDALRVKKDILRLNNQISKAIEERVRSKVELISSNII